METFLPLFVTWDVDPSMLSIGSFDIRYYGLMWAVGLAISAYLFNFMMTSWFTFKVRPSWRRFLRFAVSHGINYLIQITIFNISLLLGVSNELAPIPVYIISVPASFLLVRCAMMRSISSG